MLSTKPSIVSVEHVVGWPYLSPLWGAEYTIRVIAILSNTVQLNGVLPVLCKVLICVRLRVFECVCVCVCVCVWLILLLIQPTTNLSEKLHVSGTRKS